MFRKIRDAARAGTGKAKSLLVSTGRVAKKVGSWVGRKVTTATLAVGLALKYPARLLSWGWARAVEIYCMGQAPVTWVIVNVVWWVLRVSETVYHKVRNSRGTKLRRKFPSFTLQNAWAMTLVVVYPLVRVVNWLLSPFAGKRWTAEENLKFKYTVLQLTDQEYENRFKADLGMTVGSHRQTAFVSPTKKTREELAALYTEQGYIELDDTDELNPQQEEEVQWLVNQGLPRANIFQDTYARWWVKIPEGMVIDLTVPDHSGWVDPDADTEVEVDWRSIHHPKDRSRAFGRQYVLASIQNSPGFLDDEQQQNWARALAVKETQSPENGLQQKHVIVGFEEALEQAMAARKSASV